VDHTEELTHISLCAGYGGIDLGLKRVIPSLRTIAFSEIEAYAVANLVSKIEAGYLDAAPIWSNVKTFPFASFYGKVFILSSGFPCQPFSAAGRRKGDEDSRHLWPHIVRGIREASPKMVFFENVEGIISSKLKSNEWSDPEGTPVLLHVLRELERLGYRATAGVFSASEVGAPHQRKRVFILGSKIEQLRTIKFKRSRFPSRRGQKQYSWEPPRVKAQRSLGRGFDGVADRVDDAELYESADSSTDELRLLGNGVVPDTAARAFEVLWQRLGNADKYATWNESKDNVEKINQTNTARKTTFLDTAASASGG
tara:strand:- start:6425 stop:7360 length:936 start_codon:yes stop_codon:yes gene_type:complete